MGSPKIEMVERLARVLDPFAFAGFHLDEIVGEVVALPLEIARQESARMLARTLILALREPTELMRERGETEWRRLVDLLIDGEMDASLP